MRCHSIGRVPSITRGFGNVSEYSRIRMPKPPQKRTTFIVWSLLHMPNKPRVPSRGSGGYSSGGYNGRYGDWHDETPAPLANEVELRHDLVLRFQGRIRT